MTHEFKKIIETSYQYFKQNKAAVLATVVHLEGSSYRKPGVRMLISEKGEMTGAVSGGCVEKEIYFQAATVFRTGKAKMMTYDGRYRLGCEGILYILIEPFFTDEAQFKKILSAINNRVIIKIYVTYTLDTETYSNELGSIFTLKDRNSISEASINGQSPILKMFIQELSPLFQLFIIGSEHDAVQLALIGSYMGWKVTLIASPKDPRNKSHFPGVESVKHLNPIDTKILEIDDNSAIVLMNHNYATDLNFLYNLAETTPLYIGLLGSVKRREKLINELIEVHSEKADRIIDKLYGPAGLDISAITPQEIANAIISEIIAVARNKAVNSLRNQSEKISF
ncbi:XdhC family protein [Leeuwenhoekiella marinoflava]|uniref:Xanthine/CO dehydrogenase XdhC/CoxF family maturation factor n=2 Tax=Leeuwenhoekiella marinoflava TaxID=988 RepID=A0A4V1KQM1_9FLAO|nr:XdhC/CoxI family protein [Leeuwenhoekiella marinoflava]RXG21892.1 xanthine/CO dehydrogenase XdhC/CoxF family maturation factor [Leeuwenhoekiella marinoflava]SHG01719.1 Xanthine and CO dehydrogenase maturation factor, XdhC/CoxF family [Leeuwenhoekiella marinoflava DSM 3653]